MGCCGKPPADSTEKEPKSLKTRTCTDVLCLILFLAFVALLAGICIIGLSTGDYNEYLYEADYLGNRCGVERGERREERGERREERATRLRKAGCASALSYVWEHVAVLSHQLTRHVPCGRA